MRRPATHLALVLILSSLASCGTLLSRNSEGSLTEHAYYKGVQDDLMLLGMATDRQEGAAAAIFCYYMLVCPLLALVSLPVDAVADTLLLPVDYQQSRQPEKTVISS